MLTKIDKIAMLEDVSRTFNNKRIEEKVTEVSETLGINNNKILPVRNYKTQVECNTNMDILALRALRQILRFSKDFLRDRTQNLPKDVFTHSPTEERENKKGKLFLINYVK